MLSLNSRPLPPSLPPFLSFSLSRSLASLPLFIMGKGGKIRGATMEHLTSIAASLLFYNSQSSALLAEKRRLFQVLRRVVLLALRLLFLLLSSVLSFLTTLPSPQLSSAAASAAPDTSAARALAHVLAVVSRIPVTSSKYDLIRSLADRLLDDNLGFSRGLEAVNRAALSDAFSRTLRRLEAVAGSAPGDGSLDLVVGAVRSGLRRWTGEEKGEVPAEKLAAELLWLAQKMEACGAVEEAVARWGDAAELARIALTAEARLQAAFVRLSVFLFKLANAGLVDEENDGGEDEECSTARRGLAMLTSWLPLLCRARNGMDAPILSSRERAEMVRVLEEMIQKLNWDQQEEVLAIWLHHFTACPDSDWPNLESCYSRWYAESRGLFLK